MPLTFFADASVHEAEAGLRETVRRLYLEDEVPWVVGYSGGKDSTATLQLIWRAIEELPSQERHKPVHVISTDTLVENPIVVSWVNQSLQKMNNAAESAGLPFESHRLTPDIQNTFWVNLIGRGYPAPRHKFRWCTERLKINPSNTFIRDVVRSSGEAIVVLGTRKSESARRSRSMARLEEGRVRDMLSPNASLPNSLVFTPIEDWSNDDVWTYLMQVDNPWGYQNRDLLTLYQGASEDGECPLVVDTTTPSCGDSRFGCWVCTLVDEDKSMQAMIQNDEDKEWMQPLLDLRNELDPKREVPESRDFRRMSGLVQLYYRRVEKDSEEREQALIRGPYVEEKRHEWLRKVLQAESWVRRHGPDSVRDIELISLDEMEEIRRTWVLEKHEFEDALPRIYEEATDRTYPGPNRFEDQRLMGPDEMALLREVCGESELQFQLLRELISTEHRFRTMMSRRGLFDALEKAFKKHFYNDEEDALRLAKRRKSDVDRAAEGVLQTSLIQVGEEGG
ncbi:DNA phosphorothioation system sulfurtransferase DndC [Gaopeijia maritima]|uniref:DNA phosphorothioation system sulfurtransferase DndC n=1 Tax=Gaopeijia maritima TaxID=3119007 RepID=UPI003268F099